MSQSREAMPGSYDDQQSSSIFFDNSNDELDSILMSNWADGELESMMLDWQFDDQKFVPDSSQIIGDHQVATGTQSLSAGCDDPSLQASQDGVASETKDIAPLSDMFTSSLELDQSFIDPQLFKGSPFWIPNYTQTESLMMMEEAIHPVEPAAAPDLANPSTIISDQQQGAAGIVQPTRGPRAVLGASIKDGYNWRKYGQKNVKDSNSPRSYYKCTYPHCKVTKKEERSPQGNVTEIVYKGGRHNHPRPNPSSSASSYLKRDAPLNARQQNQNMEFNSTEVTRSSSRSGRQVKYLVVALADIDVINDGYRWRKYGSKVVKGNSNPRSYYRCTNSGCKARKLVERSPDDLKKLMTTYEGTHNHGVPGPKNSSIGGSSVRSSALPQANGSLVPRFGCPNLISPPRSLPNLPPSLAPLPTRMRMSVPILPQLSSYSGFRGPLQPGMMTMVMPKLETTIQPPPSKDTATQLPLQPMNC
ncbi:hypothetical protein ZIOFF_017918 [Zingiber officinale]|uniref:WRKY domain-containing protein n=1 Tax=Zingiber officinale TaxID=94328 RepID=A0A8J5LAK2_ZINOF|nr:hypothetical protein ZIOFF_017918 [Zingiber officinale]